MDYVLIRKPDHPNARKNGQIKLARFIMSEHLGRPLLDSEIVHHVNGIKKDDRIENLVISNQSDHAVYHSKAATACNRKHRNPKKCPNCGKEFIHKWNQVRDKCCSKECRAEYYKGIRGCNTKITQEIANQIKGLKGLLGSRKIALAFGLSPTHVKRILRGDIW